MFYLTFCSVFNKNRCLRYKKVWHVFYFSHTFLFYYIISLQSSVIFSILTTFPSFVLIRVTTCVDLHRMLISFKFILIIVPVSVIIIMSSASFTILIPITSPVFGVILYVITPFPPLI